MSIKLVKTFAKTVMYRECLRLIEELRPEQLDVLEISAGESFKGTPFRSYGEANFPEFDICTTVLPARYDLIIADQIFEHLLWPYRAGRNVFAMLRPGGHFLMATPFLIRIHPVRTTALVGRKPACATFSPSVALRSRTRELDHGGIERAFAGT